MGVVSLVLYLPGIFIEHDVSKDERGDSTSSVDLASLPKPNPFAIFSIVAGFFIQLLNFTLIEA